jgi:hypothetical protein
MGFSRVIGQWQTARIKNASLRSEMFEKTRRLEGQ